MVWKAKHLCKKNLFCIQGVEKDKKTQLLERVLIGKEIKVPGKVSIKP